MTIEIFVEPTAIHEYKNLQPSAYFPDLLYTSGNIVCEIIYRLFEINRYMTNMICLESGNLKKGDSQ